MLIFFYNIATLFYKFGISISSLFNPKAKAWIEGRRNLFEDLKKEKFENAIWFHCASVGEFEQGYPLIKKLRDQYNPSTFIITFFSPSGYEFAKKKYPEFLIFYLPLDSKRHAIQFIEIIKPKAVFFVKYEFWFHFLDHLKISKIPTFLISGIFRKEQAFFAWYGILHKKMLHCFTYLFLQNNESKELLDSIGIRNHEVFGDTRFDRVLEIRDTAFQDTIIDDFVKEAKVFIAGSIWNHDTEVLQSILDTLPPDWKIILAPHEMSHYSTQWLGDHFEFYTNYQKLNKRILVIDILGILSKSYRKSHFSYIGGGYGKGIHNILEAAIYEIPILIGPVHHKFHEAKELLYEQIAFDTSVESTKIVLIKIIQDDLFYESIREKSKHFISRYTNVSEKIWVFINTHNLIA